jgi:DNA-binding transcriptional LysR family regulator
MLIIVHMNLAAVDLNLLVAFEALMEERNVTRAGQRVGLAQPSMSSALTRLRALFADDLFVRSGSGMQPTAKAVSLARPVSEALGQIRGVFEPGSAFEPAIARRRFSIAVTDYGDFIVVPPLVRSLRREAPGIDLVVRPIIDAAESVASLERGEIDALIGGHLPGSARVTRHLLFEEHFVCIRDARRAKRDAPLTNEDYPHLPHVLFRPPAATDFPAPSIRCWLGIDANAGLRSPSPTSSRCPLPSPAPTSWQPWPSALRIDSQQSRPWRSFRFPTKCRLLPSSLSTHAAPWPIRHYAGSSRWLIGCVNRSDDSQFPGTHVATERRELRRLQGRNGQRGHGLDLFHSEP